MKNKTKVISADLLDFDFDLELDFQDNFIFFDISVLVTAGGGCTGHWLGLQLGMADTRGALNMVPGR